MDNIFYVYEHWRPDTGQCFYVGKGKDRRSTDMHRGRNRYHKFIQDKLASMGMSVEVKIYAGGLSEEEAFGLERVRIKHWKDAGLKLANMSEGGEGPTGHKHTEEWKKENSLRNKGRKMSPERNEKVRLFHLGRKRSAETCKRISESRLGKPLLKLRGRKKSDETRKRISEAKIGKPNLASLGIPKSEETKRRISEKKKGVSATWLIGVPKSEEHRRKLSEFNLGKTHTEETRAKLRAIGIADWERRRALKAQNVVKEV